MQNSQDRVSAFKVFAKVINYILEGGGKRVRSEKKRRGKIRKSRELEIILDSIYGILRGNLK